LIQSGAALACEPKQHITYSGCRVEDMGLSEDFNHVAIHLNLGHCKVGQDVDMDYSVRLKPEDQGRLTLREIARKARYANRSGKKVQLDAVCSEGKEPKAVPVLSANSFQIID
jgi:hypothetical protein